MRFLQGLFLGLVSAVWGLVFLLWQGFVIFWLATWHFTQSYVATVNRFTQRPGEETRRKLFRFTPIRLMFRFFLYLFVPFVILIVPVGFVASLSAVLVAIDQSTKPDLTVSPNLLHVASGVDEEKPTLRDVGVMLFETTYHQYEREMNSFFGWTPNDMWGLQHWDNRVNRQLGVRYCSVELLRTLSPAISKFGSVDEEDTRLVTAHQRGLAYDPYDWIFPMSESKIREGFHLIQDYQDDLLNDAVDNATINITARDLEIILLAISGLDNDDKQGILEVPHSRLTKTNADVSWTDLDDRVFFAQGCAVVARDALVVMRYAFEQKIIDAGAMENMNRAIQNLESATQFQPWWVMRGEWDSMFADHRAKMARYYNDARKRIVDVAEAIKR